MIRTVATVVALVLALAGCTQPDVQVRECTVERKLNDQAITYDCGALDVAEEDTFLRLTSESRYRFTVQDGTITAAEHLYTLDDLNKAAHGELE